MDAEIIFAGFGGQGIMTMGTTLAAAGMREGRRVTWLPSYGAEQRGGTANCTVVISGEAIASPIVDRPGILVVMNAPSLDKFEKAVSSGGLVFVNSSLIDRPLARSDVREFRIPANELAGKIGNSQVANMVMLGALVARTGLVSFSTLEEIAREATKGRAGRAQMNLAALRTGHDFPFA